jgi:hypothetical protein
MSDETAAPPKTPSAVSRWKKLGKPQEVTLHSGMRIKIKVPDVPEMLRAGEVPNELIAAVNEARDDVSPSGFDMEKVKDATDYMRWLVSVTVVEIDEGDGNFVAANLEPDDVPSLPVHDRDMILEFALRQRDRDAVGHQLYGMEKVSAWARFRDGGTVD